MGRRGSPPLICVHNCASYYGAQFQGRRTASGEPYNVNGLTAAHRTLPFGTKLLVTNQWNQQSVVVTVNDRGPFAHRRVIDLSDAAAKRIGCVSTGTCPVSLKVLGATDSEAHNVPTHVSDVPTRSPPETLLAANTPIVPKKTYTVRRGDTLAKIARDHNVSVDTIQQANKIGMKHTLRPNQRLRVDC
mmetsp:Transcript_41665/g.67579  ORF Transcript_41665/g.67579 Transcript_41665/m.67579 type:complete len:188 (-) Transcript_41665:335-898(-)